MDMYYVNGVNSDKAARSVKYKGVRAKHARSGQPEYGLKIRSREYWASGAGYAPTRMSQFSSDPCAKLVRGACRPFRWDLVCASGGLQKLFQNEYKSMCQSECALEYQARWLFDYKSVSGRTGFSVGIPARIAYTYWGNRLSLRSLSAQIVRKAPWPARMSSEKKASSLYALEFNARQSWSERGSAASRAKLGPQCCKRLKRQTRLLEREARGFGRGHSVTLANKIQAGLESGHCQPAKHAYEVIDHLN
ncbi:hypothetical protein C8R43DRAFT_957681 [Mycena crocata]|nr:hypothetical protein C8R43DRAFT_957681 [Mycena crocata]